MLYNPGQHCSYVTAIIISMAGQTFDAFPFPPYDIQTGFMRGLYQALEKGGVGLFESPTGTGKTLSLICGSLHWLHDHRQREAAAAAAGAERPSGAADDDEDPDWMRDFASQQKSQLQEEQEARRKRRLAKAKAKLGPQAGGRRHLPPPAPAPSSQDPDAEFLVEDWDSGGEGGKAAGSGSKRAIGAPLSDTDTSDSDRDGGVWGEGEEGEGEAPRKTQIIFASRTHSQLTQFVGELHRTRFADEVSLVALGSRRALCVNDAVLRLSSPALINERCLELQKPGASKKAATAGPAAAAAAPGAASGVRPRKAAGKCSFLTAGSRAADATRDMILAHPMDIEELARLGRRRSVCPYYSSRRALPEADLVLAPYSALLVADTRRSLGLRVEGNVIIVDEAHNLVDAINGAHSAELPAATAALAHRQLAAYFDRFRTRLAPGNARNIQALMRVADALATAAGPCPKAGPTSTPPTAAQALRANDFLFTTGLDNVNMFKLAAYVRESKAVFKIAGFWQAAAQQQALAGAGGGELAAEREGSTGALHSLVAFMLALTNEDADGRVIVDVAASTVKFVLLNAAAHFAQVVASARAVVLASGTLSPLPPVLQLFPGVPPTSIHRYSCGHVVGQERLLALALGTGPSGAALDFRHAARAVPATMDELGRLVSNVCAAVPGGVVVFFSSFSYADQVYARWEATDRLQALGTRKRVFREPRSAGEVESCLEEYASCMAPPAPEGGTEGRGVGAQTGAVMLCVVGGKLAEGINFGDALGRCVIMVGLPYPNASDPELQERLHFIDRTAQGGGQGQAASREHYQNLCMKAVNQCVGRVIRHRGDYAAILMVDVRYAAAVDAAGQHTGPLAKLPDWIRQSLVVCKGFGQGYGRLVRFFKGTSALDGGALAGAAAQGAAVQ